MSLIAAPTQRTQVVQRAHGGNALDAVRHGEIRHQHGVILFAAGFMPAAIGVDQTISANDIKVHPKAGAGVGIGEIN